MSSFINDEDPKFEVDLPTMSWGECILTTTHIINLLPLNVIDGKTPYEVVINWKLEYEHLKVFGCLAYFQNTKTKWDKFEPRGRPGVFLGHLWGTKVHKIYDIEHKKIITTRDVKFVDIVFPFTKSKITKEDEDIFISPKY